MSCQLVFTSKTSNKHEQQNKKLKSAIFNHSKRESYIMDQDNARIVGTEDNNHCRWIREIQKQATGIRRNEPLGRQQVAVETCQGMKLK